MPKAKVAIKSSKPQKQRPRARSVGKENYFAVKHLNFKLYDEDAEILNKVLYLSAVGSLCTQVFRSYFANIAAIFHGKLPHVLPEDLSRPPFENALIPIPMHVWQAYQVLARNAKTNDDNLKGVSDALMLKAIEAYIHKIRPERKQKKRIARQLEKNNSAWRWKKHLQISYLNFHMYDEDALNANKLPNLKGFANICTNALRAYYFHIHDFYQNSLNDFFPTATKTPPPFMYALLPLPPALWDSYVEHARDHFAETGERISAETWMLRGIEVYHAANT